MSKHKKTNQEIGEMLNFSQNAKYCELRRNKFWNIIATNKSAELPLFEEEAQQKAYNEEYITAHGNPHYLACK